MKNKLNAIALTTMAVVLAASLCVLAGCSGSSKGNQQTLTMLTTSKIVPEELESALAQSVPGVKLEFISYSGYNQTGYIRECLETDNSPDIIISTIQQSDALAKETMLDLSGYSFVNNYSDTWLNQLNVDGAVYQVPSKYTPVCFYYNKTILSELGLEAPQTFEDVVNMAPIIEAAGYKTCTAKMDLDGYSFCDFFGLGNTFYFNTVEGNQWKKDFLTGDATATGNVEAVLEYFGEWVDAGFISASDIKNSKTGDEFAAGKVAFQFSLGMSSYTGTTEDGKAIEFGVLPWLPHEGQTPMIISNVNCYFSLNKHLGDKGNEAKLEQAVKVMEYLSTDEGQNIIRGGEFVPLDTNQISSDSVYYSVKDLISGGNMIPLVYGGWDDLIVPMAQQLYSYIKGESSVSQVLSAWDSTRDTWLADGAAVIANVPKTLEKKDLARLVGMAQVSSMNCDCALVSLGDYHGSGCENGSGVECPLYPGGLTDDRVRTFIPMRATVVIEKTGAEIKKMQQEGYVKTYTGDVSGDADKPFEYVLTVRNDAELQDDTIYKLAISSVEISTEEAAQALTKVEPSDFRESLEKYIPTLGTDLTVESLKW